MASLTAAELKTAGLRLELSHDLEERYGSVREGFLAVDKNREGYIGLNEFVKLFQYVRRQIWFHCANLAKIISILTNSLTIYMIKIK